MTKFLKYALFVFALALGTSTIASAGDGFGPGKHQQAPEIDPSLALGAISLIGGSLLVQRSRRSR